MSSDDLHNFKKDMSSTVQRSKLSLIKKRASNNNNNNNSSGGHTPQQAVVRTRSSGHHSTHSQEHVHQEAVQRMKDDQPLEKQYPAPPQLQQVTPPIPTPEQQQQCSSSNNNDIKDEKVNQNTCKTSTSEETTKVNKTTATTSKKNNTLRCSVQWICQECSPPNACIPVRSESRCLCGHRYKEHTMQLPKAGVPVTPENVKFKCSSKSCSCKHFFFIVAEGAWILRCRCKHKHVEHDCGTKPFKCKKPRCSCNGFDSPWVCNCGHPWSSHLQQVVETAQPTGLIAEALKMHHDQELMAGGSSGPPDKSMGNVGLGGADMVDMVGLLSDSSAMRDLDLNVRRDGGT